MHKIYIYRTRSGKEPVLDYLNKLKSKNDKDSNIKKKKIYGYIVGIVDGLIIIICFVIFIRNPNR